MKSKEKKSPFNHDEKPTPGLVPPVLALIFSLIIPGLGQVLSKNIRRGAPALCRICFSGWSLVLACKCRIFYWS